MRWTTITLRTGYDFKFGAIIRPIEGSSFRVGVSATTPTVYRLRDSNSAYRNISTTNTGTLGIGYRGDVFYADASLLYSLQSSNFFPFDDPELPATLVSRNLWKGTVTVGLRF